MRKALLAALIVVALAAAPGYALFAFAPHPDHVKSFTEAVHRGYLEGDPAYYYNGEASPQEYAHAVMTALIYFEDNIIGDNLSTTTTTLAPVTTSSTSTTTTTLPTTTTSTTATTSTTMAPPTTTSTTTSLPSDTVPFLSYRKVDNIVIDGGTDIELSEVSITGGDIAITLRNVDGAYIHDIDFENVVGGIYIYNSTDVVIDNVRGRNVGDEYMGLNPDAPQGL